MWWWTSRWMYTTIKHQQKCQKSRYIWLINPAQNTWVLDQTWSSYQSMNKWILHHPGRILHFSHTDLLWYPRRWTQGDMCTLHRLKSIQEHKWCTFPCAVCLSHSGIMRTAHQSKSSVFQGCSSVSMNAQRRLHECEMCLSITGRTDCLLCTRGEIMSFLMNEVSVSPQRNFKLFPILN